MKLPEFLAFETCSNILGNTMGTKADMPGDEFWLMGFQFMSSEQAIVTRNAECEEGKEVAHCQLPRRASANQRANGV